ncbi:MAG: hypothetical protein ACYCYM_04735 [Saccharofermentanales bacterium]
MANEFDDLRKELHQLKYEHNFIRKYACSKDENRQYRTLKKSDNIMPDGIYEYNDLNDVPLDSFYKISESDLSVTEKSELLYHYEIEAYRDIGRIKSCLLILTSLIAIALLVLLINALVSQL